MATEDDQTSPAKCLLARADTIPTGPHSAEAIEAIARLLGTTFEEIESRMLPPTRLIGTNSQALLFHDTPIRLKLREYRWRRLSPRALQVSNHYRAMWDFRPLSYDPETLEFLVHECPECDRPLSWGRCLGISKCSKCLDDRGVPTVDMRDYPQALVETDDPASLRLIGRLLSHDPLERSETMRGLPMPWHEFTPSEVVELILAMAGVLASNGLKEVAVAWRPKVDELDVLSPAVIGRASRMVIEGEAGLDDLIQSVREQRKSEAHVNRTAELGQLAHIHKDAHLSPAVRKALLAGLERGK